MTIINSKTGVRGPHIYRQNYKTAFKGILNGFYAILHIVKI